MDATNTDNSTGVKRRRQCKLDIAFELTNGSAHAQVKACVQALHAERSKVEELHAMNVRLRETYFRYRDYSEMVQDEPLGLQRRMTWSERRVCETSDAALADAMAQVREQRDEYEIWQRRNFLHQKEIDDLYTQFENLETRKQYLKDLRAKKEAAEAEYKDLVEKKWQAERDELAEVRKTEMRRLRKLIFAPGELPAETLEAVHHQTLELQTINESPSQDVLQQKYGDLKRKIAQIKEDIKRNQTQNLFL